MRLLERENDVLSPAPLYSAGIPSRGRVRRRLILPLVRWVFLTRIQPLLKRQEVTFFSRERGALSVSASRDASGMLYQKAAMLALVLQSQVGRCSFTLHTRRLTASHTLTSVVCAGSGRQCLSVDARG